MKSPEVRILELLTIIQKWHFNFDDHYDLYIWDAVSGRPFEFLSSRLMEVRLLSFYLK